MILNTGIGIILYGSPILLILLTFLVSIIETQFLKKYLSSFWRTFKKIFWTNLITTFIGILIIVLFNLTNIIDLTSDFIVHELNAAKKGIIYFFLLTSIIAIPNFLLTVVIEYLILKKVISIQLKIRDVFIANLMSYLTLVFIWVIILNL